MTTFFPFAPSTLGVFQFTPTMDGQSYNAVCPWSLFGQRYYLSLFDLNGNLIFSLPVIGSDAAVPIQNMDWENGTVTVTGEEDLSYAIGQTVDLTIKGAVPTAYNGLQRCLIINKNQVTFSLPTFPGFATVFGQISKEINIAGGYFQVSSLIFRVGSSSFEVDP